MPANETKQTVFKKQVSKRLTKQKTNTHKVLVLLDGAFLQLGLHDDGCAGLGTREPRHFVLLAESLR